MITNKTVILRLFVPVMILMTLVGMSSTVVGQTYPAGMIAYWKFDEGNGTVAYSSVGQHPGNVSGPDWTAGRVGGALYFEGTPGDDFVVVPHHADLNVPSNEISIEAWVNFTGEVGAWDHEIVSKVAGFLSYGYQFRLINGVLAIVIANGVNYTTAGYLMTGSQMPYGWRHVVGVYSDAQDLARLYVDGVQAAENTSFTTVLNNSGNASDLYIGKWGPDQGQLWKGVIDEVAIYNRILLPEEIAEHYQNGLNGLGYEIRTIAVAIDIKPGSDPNSINPQSKGVIAVAILTNDDFDATTVDPLSVAFGPNGAKETHGKGHIEDIDGDGDNDLVLHFKTPDTGIQCGDIETSLTGQTFNERAITGTDAIQTVGCGVKKAAAETETSIPENHALFQNHPNPFWSAATPRAAGNPTTFIVYSLPQPAQVELKVYDVLGHEVRVLVNDQKPAGVHRVPFDGQGLPGGLYFYRLRAGEFVETKKMLVIR